MNNEKFHELLREILNTCIPKNKISIFEKHIINYDLNPSSFNYIVEERKPNRQKISTEELKERLHKKLNKVFLTIDDNKEAMLLCDEIINKIKYNDKKYYYYLGVYLRRFKKEYDRTDVPFNKFVEDRYKIKYSTLNKYIRFSKLCEIYSQLLKCDLGFDVIMKNVPEIEEILRYSE